MSHFSVDEFSAPPFWRNGPAPGVVFNFPSSSADKESEPARVETHRVTGTSVVGITFNGGVVIAADMQGTLDKLAKFRDCSRVVKVSENIILGCSGDYADFQFMQYNIERKIIEEECLDDGYTTKPRALFAWLTRVMYNRRSQFNPLMNTFLVGGMQDGEPFLGSVDRLGTAYTDHHIATGYGAHLVLPMMREVYAEVQGQLTREASHDVVAKCMETLYYRDARASSRYQVATATDEGITIKGPLTFQTNWDVAFMI